MDLSALECDPYMLFKELRSFKKLDHYLRHPDGHYAKLRYEWHIKDKSYVGESEKVKDHHRIEVRFKNGFPIKIHNLPRTFRRNGIHFELELRYSKLADVFMYLCGLGFRWTIPTEKKHPTNHGPFFKEYFTNAGVEITKEGRIIDLNHKAIAVSAKKRAERIVGNYQYYELARAILTPQNNNVAIFGGFARDMISGYWNAFRAARSILMIRNNTPCPATMVRGEDSICACSAYEITEVEICPSKYAGILLGSLQTTFENLYLV